VSQKIYSRQPVGLDLETTDDFDLDAKAAADSASPRCRKWKNSCGSLEASAPRRPAKNGAHGEDLRGQVTLSIRSLPFSVPQSIEFTPLRKVRWFFRTPSAPLLIYRQQARSLAPADL